jgi:chromosome segregation ATPase
MGYLKDRIRLVTRSDLESVRHEIAELRTQAKQSRSSGRHGQEERISRLLERSRQQGRAIRAAERSLTKLVSEVRLLQQDYVRLAQQLASSETRIEWLAEKVEGGGFASTDPERAEARSLVEAIRREHEQIRVRFQVVTGYEERLGRVEKTVAATVARLDHA